MTRSFLFSRPVLQVTDLAEDDRLEDEANLGDALTGVTGVTGTKRRLAERHKRRRQLWRRPRAADW